MVALFIGSWSDQRGRKLPLLIGLTGKLIDTLGILLNIYFCNNIRFFKTNLCIKLFFIQIVEWPLDYIIYTAKISSAITGIDMTIFAISFAYISDVSTIENRTWRISIVSACSLVAFPTGKFLGIRTFV